MKLGTGPSYDRCQNPFTTKTCYFNHVMHGFSARLTPSQASEIKKSPAHIAMHEEKSGKLFTTHSPQFMGLRYSSGLWNASSYGEGLIIGMIDSGVWPESDSFNEKGMPAVPTRWKGKCQNITIDPFTCNRKLIGAQVFIKGSQAAGASQFGYAQGVARGLAPGAHVAMYKVSSGELIVESDVLAAMDQAIADGVYIMSLSLCFYQTACFEDVIAIAPLSAIEKGIVVVCSAGNDGEPCTTQNAAPWITTFGAGTLDRSFTATHSKPDFTIFFWCFDKKKYATEAADDARVKIMRFVLTSFGTKPAPQVAYFSSRGPNPISPNILKPNIIAPGVDVLAAIPPTIQVQYLDNYLLGSDYALYSGTSMAAPHVAGVTALLKAVHPEWSPSAIRSALMTTAYTIDNNGTILTDQSTDLPGTPLHYGAGHINPNKAMDPGLIYDIDWQGYVDFLCGLGYSDAEMKAILRQSQWNCSQEQMDINYPSFVAMFNATSPNVKKFTRVVTNVGDDQSVYHAVVETTYGMTFTVEPSTLTFTNKYQKQTSFHLISFDELMTTTYNINNNGTALTNQLHDIRGTPLDINDIEFQGFLCSLGYNDAQMRGDNESNYEAIATTSNGVTITVKPPSLIFTEKY
ncbi:putative Subtilisin-like serine protease 2 [Hibiscus syriacus]|uniref:Subtilisin-like serine protease 2 n=1 Tax=Hibiscus syriacus TaxID=106335 RepID=A0A6A3CKS3_HIBSY|nr:putative Subtilisin-like serine protease 2 [Hibiscus syriacus]